MIRSCLESTRQALRAERAGVLIHYFFAHTRQPMPGLSILMEDGKMRAFALLLLPLLLGCGSEVAQVGHLSISEKDLSRQVRVFELYFPGSGQRCVALSQLIRGYLAGGPRSPGPSSG